MTIEQPCDACEGGTVWISRYGGNDPDVWAVTCEECEGTGIVFVEPEDADECE